MYIYICIYIHTIIHTSQMKLELQKGLWMSPLWQYMLKNKFKGLSEIIVGEIVVELPYECMIMVVVVVVMIVIIVIIVMIVMIVIVVVIVIAH